MRNWLEENPFCIIFTLSAVGIVLADNYIYEPYRIGTVSIIGALLVVVSMYIKKTPKVVKQLYTALFVISIAALLATVQKPKDYLPNGEYLNMTLSIDDNTTTYGKWQRVYGVLQNYSMNNSPEVYTNQKVAINIDTLTKVKYGDIIECRGYLNQIDKSSGYGKTMARRGVFKSTFIPHKNIISVRNRPQQGIVAWAKLTQQKASQRIESLNLSPDALAITAAMSIGDKSKLTSQIKSSFSQSGVSHVLAVSGLHVGIVFLLITIIIAPMSLISINGLIWRCVIGMVAIWIFAIISGLSPSVVRAAIMFTMAHIAYCFNRDFTSLNTIAATATVMIYLNPMWLFDVSFQLSFIAVVSLAILARPISNMLRIKNKKLRKLNSSFSTSLAATLGTAPIVAYYFNMIPIFAFIVNIPIIFLTYIVVQVAVLWIALPIDWFATPIRFILNTSAESINIIAKFTSSLPYSHIEREPSIIIVYVCYILLIFAAIMANKYSKKESYSRIKR